MPDAYRSLTPQARRELVPAAKVDPKTLRRCYLAPETAQPISLERVAAAAKALGLPPPSPRACERGRR